MKRFTVGDVITIEGSDGAHIVSEVRFLDEVCIATNRSAWHRPMYCTLVRKVNNESLRQLRKDMEDEDEGEEL